MSTNNQDGVVSIKERDISVYAVTVVRLLRVSGFEHHTKAFFYADQDYASKFNTQADPLAKRKARDFYREQQKLDGVERVELRAFDAHKREIPL